MASMASWRELPYDVDHLVKLAQATDPRTSSIAVYGQSGKCEIWGLVDQGTHYFDFMNLDTDSAQAFRPGLFQASIEGVAHVAAWIDYYKVAELRGSLMLGAALDALPRGRLRKALAPFADTLLSRAREIEPNEIPGTMDGANGEAYRKMSQALRRILLRARGYRHGGAILLLPEGASLDGLNVKYPLAYGRLADALAHHLSSSAMQEITQDIIFQELDQDAETLDMTLYLDNAIAGNELEDLSREIDSVAWFIALLTRLDGLVVFNHELCVCGFGAVIETQDEPPKVVQAISAPGGRVKHLDYTAFGTRHRSMMRACWATKGSVGFVVSQDGMVRAMTASETQVVVWPDLMLQRLERAPRVPTAVRGRVLFPG
jgi:hypothetical protein